MNTKTLIVVLLACLLLCGCKRTKKFVITQEVADDPVLVFNGIDADGSFSMIPGTYELVENNDTLQVELSIVINETIEQRGLGEFSAFDLIPLDEEMKLLDGGNVRFHASNGLEVVKQIFNAEVGSNMKVKFQCMPTDEKQKDMIFDQLASCHICLYFHLVEQEKAGK